MPIVTLQFPKVKHKTENCNCSAKLTPSNCSAKMSHYEQQSDIQYGQNQKVGINT